jgi:hypothetical protein
MQLGKEIPVGECMKFKIGSDAYDLVSHPNFGMLIARKGQTFGTFATGVSVPTGIYGTNWGAILPGRVPLVYGKFTY